MIVLTKSQLSANELGSSKIYTTKDGLPSNTVYAIEQDDLGYIWFGTDKGLSRFDGTEFVNFGINDGSPDSDILKFYKDSRDQIWCYTINGNLAVIYGGEIHYSTKDGLKLSPIRGIITSMIEVNEGYFVSTDKAVWRVDKGGIRKDSNIAKTGKLTSESHEVYLSYMGSFLSESVRKYDARSDEWQLLDSRGVPGQAGYFVQLNGVIYSHTGHGIRKPKLVSRDLYGDISSVEFSNRIHNLKVEEEQIIVFTSNGNYHYNPKTSEVKLVFEDISGTDYLLDTSGNRWWGSLDNGVVLVRKNESLDVLSGKNFREVSFKSGCQNIFLITEKRDSLFKLNDQRVEFVINGYGIFDYFRWKGQVLSLGQSTDGVKSMLFGTSIIQFKDKYLISRYNRVAVLSMRADSIANENEIWSDSFANVRTILGPNDSSFYFLNRQGLFKSTWDDPPEVTPVYDSYQTHSALVNDYGVILGTNGAGLIHLDRGDTLYATTGNNLLSSDFVRKIVMDDNQIWVMTSEGIELLTIENSQFRFNHKITGVPGKIQSFDLLGNQLVIASSEGLFKLSIENASESLPEAKFVLNEFFSKENAYDVNSSIFTLPAENREFELDYSVLFFHPELTLSSRYRMVPEGNQESQDWIYSDESRLTMSNLQAGNYTLEIEFKHRNIEWTNAARLEIRVLPFWWETLWFRLLMLVLVSLLITYSSFKINDLIRARKRQRTDLLLAELRSRKAQLNPHFVSNALNSIRNYILVNNLSQSDKFLTTYSKLMRKILDMSNKTIVPVVEEIEALSLYLNLEHIRLRGSFEFKVIIDDTLDVHKLRCPALITQPYVENAIVHGMASLNKEGQIRIMINDLDEKIQFVITDNGVGFDHSIKKENSFGRFIAEDKIRLLKETYAFDIDVNVQSETNRGTRVSITLPKISR